MSTLVNQIQKLSHDYVRKGSKANRRLQVGRILKFIEFIEQTEKPNNLHEIGRRHVKYFWKHHRQLSAKTAHAYWLAFCLIWEWSGKTGKPPKPFIFSIEKNDTSPHEVVEVFLSSNGNITDFPSLYVISRAVKALRCSRGLIIETVSEETGIGQTVINDVEAANSTAKYIDVIMLYKFLSSNFRNI